MRNSVGPHRSDQRSVDDSNTEYGMGAAYDAWRSRNVDSTITEPHPAVSHSYWRHENDPPMPTTMPQAAVSARISGGLKRRAATSYWGTQRTSNQHPNWYAAKRNIPSINGTQSSPNDSLNKSICIRHPESADQEPSQADERLGGQLGIVHTAGMPHPSCARPSSSGADQKRGQGAPASAP